MVEETIVTRTMVEQFSDPQEKLLFAERIKKVSTWNKSQNRILVVTSSMIYVFEKMFWGQQVGRRYPIADLAAYT